MSSTSSNYSTALIRANGKGNEGWAYECFSLEDTSVRIFVRYFCFFAALALAACGGRSIVPMQSPFTALSFDGNAVANATDPCETLSKDGIWYFHGPCLAQDVKKTSTTYKLKAYKGIAQTLKYPALSASLPANSTLITGEGTGSSDITGTFTGTKFPLYGAKGVPCVNGSGSSGSCVGTALVYDLLANATANNAMFTGSPSIALVARSLKHDRSCVLNQLIQRGAGWAWEVTPVGSFTKKDTVSLPTDSISFHVDSHTIEVLAVSCLPKTAR